LRGVVRVGVDMDSNTHAPERDTETQRETERDTGRETERQRERELGSERDY